MDDLVDPYPGHPIEQVPADEPVGHNTLLEGGHAAARHPQRLGHRRARGGEPGAQLLVYEQLAGLRDRAGAHHGPPRGG